MGPLARATAVTDIQLPPDATEVARRPLVRRSGLALAWQQIAPPIIVALALIPLRAEPIGRWTIPVLSVSVAGVLWASARVRQAGLHELIRFIAGFLVFTAIRELADDFGPAAYIYYPIVIDRAIGFGTLPTLWLREHFPGFEFAAVLVYTSYFVVPPLVIGLIWHSWPERLRPYVSAVLALFGIAAIVHFVLPTAPPWLAARLGAMPGVRPLVLDYFHAALPRAYQFGTGVSANFVAAMPSVHLGVTTLICCALWKTPLRWVAVAYLLVMALTVVYTGDHYVADVLAGMLLGALCWRWAIGGRASV